MLLTPDHPLWADPDHPGTSEEPCLACGRASCTCDRDYNEARDREVLGWLEAIPLGALVALGWALVLTVVTLTRNPHAWPVFTVCAAFTGWWLLPATHELASRLKGE